MDKSKGGFCECLHQLGDHANLRYGYDLIGPDANYVPVENVISNLQAIWRADQCKHCECSYFIITFNQEKLIKAFEA